MAFSLNYRCALTLPVARRLGRGSAGLASPAAAASALSLSRPRFLRECPHVPCFLLHSSLAYLRPRPGSGQLLPPPPGSPPGSQEHAPPFSTATEKHLTLLDSWPSPSQGRGIKSPDLRDPTYSDLSCFSSLYLLSLCPRAAQPF